MKKYKEIIAKIKEDKLNIKIAVAAVLFFISINSNFP
jgi:hypothetical protein